MTLTAGTILGAYEVVGALGAGGMGEVYRARDSRLKRNVAIKVLPAAVALDGNRVARFQREAEVLASLNHSNIEAIYGLERDNAVQFLVLELIEGETLASRIARGRVPVEEALRIAEKIADALEAAHDRGITHRDLKPANVKVTPDGGVKVLDFGLAKVYDPGRPDDGSQAPTVLSTSTPGMILGTPKYMSPEQATGQDADRTSDVWSFGCVLYELLTGREAFAGATASEILAAVLKTEPDWQHLPADTPASIHRLLRRCLQKDRKRRLHHLADARIEIDEARSSSPLAHAVPESRRRDRLWMTIAGTFALIATVAIGWDLRPTPLPPQMKFYIPTAPTTFPTVALSPNGKQIAYSALSEGQQVLWVYTIEAGSSSPLAGTEGASYMFWSPDGSSLGFIADGSLKWINLGGGSVKTLASQFTRYFGGGGSWMTDGTILFAAAGTEPILRVSSDGLQQRTPVTKLYPSESSHRFPQWFPDGRQFLYQAVATDAERRGVYVGRTDGSESTRVLGAGWSAAVLAPVQRQLLAVRNGELIAHDIDLSTGKLTGGLPKKVAENVPVDPILYAPISASAGHLAYRSGAPGRRQLTSVNRDGTEPQRVGEPDTSAEENPTIDRTGRVGVQRIIGLGIDIWLLGGSSEPRQLTFATGFPPGSYVRSHPVFSPDGRRIVLSLIPASVGAADLYVVPSTGTKGGERLLKTDGFTVASDWSYPEGRYLLYTMLNPRTGRDVWALPMSPDGLKDGEPIPVARSIASEQDAQFVLDGRFVAYQTNRSRREEIVLKSFTGKDDREIPVGTGTLPRWSRQKGELIYLAPDGYLYAVSIRMAANGQDADIGQRTRLFDTRVGGVPTDRLAIYPGGDRFLLRPLLDATQSPITVILNWNPNP